MKALCCAMTSLLCLSCTVTSKEIAEQVAGDPLLADAAERLLGEAEHVGES